MKIHYRYRFITGEMQEIEVTEDQYILLMDADREEHNNDRTNTRRHISMDMAQENEGMQFADPSSLPISEGIERLHIAMEMLFPDEQTMIQAIYFDGVPVGEYAKRAGVSQPAISQRLATVKKKLKKILSEPYI